MLIYSAIYKTAFAFMNRNKRLEHSEEETYLFLALLSVFATIPYFLSSSISPSISLIFAVLLIEIRAYHISFYPIFYR